MPDQDQILLHTKLHRPHLPRDLVIRTRLVEWLGDGTDTPLTLVCAPAGFGKTSLVCSWLERMAASQVQETASLPSAWLSLDANDSDLNIFLRYFIAAIRTVFHEACEATLALLQAPQQTPQAVLFATFSNELNDLPEKVIFVLDDYHTIRNMEVHKLLGELMHHWAKPLRLVLISRIDPPLPLSGLRAKGMIREIRTQDLRFTSEETAAYLEQSQFTFLGKDALPLLEERLEGWPAGLHLAALSLRSAGSQEAVLSALSGENTNITGYLVDEVLTNQLPAIQSFLLKTSIFDRFCASLCEAVMGEIDPAWSVRACLDWIERSELFITGLDSRREWYRYHHLFQELLQQRLSAEIGPGQVADLHRLASNWFEKHGLLEEALHHSLAAGDWDLTARQMSAGLRDVLNREDRPTLERWLRLLPEGVIQQYPGLLLIRAWVLQFLFWHDLQIQVVGQVEDLLNSNRGDSLLESDLQILHGQLLLMKGQQAYYNNQTTRVIDLCKRVLAIFPPAWKFIRSGAMLYLGMSLQSSGQALEAERLLLSEYETCADKTDAYAVRILLPLCFNYLNTGQLAQTRKIAEVMHQAADRSGLAIVKIEILALRAVTLEAQGETSEADSTLKQAVDLARPGGFIRVFADLGIPMQKILYRLADQGHSVMTVQRILAAFPADHKDPVGGQGRAQPVHHPSLSNLTLAEPLPSREPEILALLREPLSIKEIASKLNILPATARRHTVNIYGKLGVNKRWNAVARAEELNILPPR